MNDGLGAWVDCNALKIWVKNGTKHFLESNLVLKYAYNFHAIWEYKQPLLKCRFCGMLKNTVEMHQDVPNALVHMPQKITQMLQELISLGAWWLPTMVAWYTIGKTLNNASHLLRK